MGVVLDVGGVPACECGAASFTDMPEEIVSEIAIRAAGLRALRSVVRFDLRDVAATKIARWFHSVVRLYIDHRERPAVGDRVMCRWPASLNKKPCYATVVGCSGYHHGRVIWRIWLFDGAYVKVHSARIRSLEPWKDAVWGDGVGRTSALAAASVAREAATHATTVAWVPHPPRSRSPN